MCETKQEMNVDAYPNRIFTEIVESLNDRFNTIYFSYDWIPRNDVRECHILIPRHVASSIYLMNEVLGFIDTRVKVYFPTMYLLPVHINDRVYVCLRFRN